MPTRRSRARLATRHLARAVAALSMVMLATSVWLTVDPQPDLAAAAPEAGVARIGHPEVNNTSDFTGGGSDTDFAVRLPTGADCTGDTASDGYLVQSYMVPASVDPATLTYGNNGPEPLGTGADFRQPLYSTAGSPYANAGTDIKVGPDQGGHISGIPAFDFSVYGTSEEETGPEIVPEGTYNLGIACTLNPLPPEPPDQILDKYWNVQIAVTHDPADEPAGFTWTVASPQAVTTVLGLTATPASSAPAGEEVTLTATVDPATATGTVTFLDGTTELETAAVDGSGGTATLVTSTLAAGNHTLTAEFTPADEAAHTPSSDNLEYLITAGDTTVTLTANPPSTAVAGTPVALTAALSPADAEGTVTFLDGATALNATPVIVSDGTATFTADDLAGGEHTLTAAFTPTPGSGGTAATSPALTYTITPAEVTVTLAASPGSPAPVGEEVTFTATLSPATATGSVTFLDGTDELGVGPVAVNGGKATLALDDLAVGDHPMTAAFAPEEGSGLAEATSAPLTYQIVEDAEAVTVTLAASPGSPAPVGEEVTFTATVSPGTATGSVTFFDGDDALGDPVTLDQGEATAVVSDLAVGSHTLTAAYAAPDGSVLDDAISEPLTYEIVEQAPPDDPAPDDAPADDPPNAGGPAGTPSLGALPVTGSSGSIAFWGVLLVVAGRVAVLLGRPPRVVGPPGT